MKVETPSLLIALLVAGSLLGEGVDDAEAPREPLRAFPGAEGFGAHADGGRGGRVLRVTHLRARGPGSLQAACAAEGPRIVVFAVGGVIHGDVTIPHGDLTLLGQTAPGPAITIAGQLATDYGAPERVRDVIIRFIRVRPLEAQGASGDAIQISRADRVILDHVSASWACDETIDIFEATEVTLQWSTIEESLLTGHPEGPHNYGLISGPRGRRVSIHHNLFAHHRRRCPAVANGPADIRNNVVYNFRDGFLHDNRSNDEGFNIVGNYYKAGPSDAKIFPFCFQDGVRYYLSDNWIEGTGRVDDPWREAERHPGLSYYAGRGQAAAEPFAVPGVTTHRPREALELVLARAGCLPHDAVTRRTVGEVRNGNGAWGRGAGPLDARGAAETPPEDGDGDGLPDDWEAAHGLDPRNGADSRKLLASGYAAIEEYANERAAELRRRTADANGEQE